MGRRVAALWHATFSIAVGALYFFFVLPRTHELIGDTSHALGTALRIVAGVLIALAALPVVFTLLRSRKPEYGTPQLALTLRTWSIVAHVLAGVLIGGTAISEIWLSLDTAGQWLFGIYGAAAAVAVLGIFGFYLSLVAELPPPPPKPLKTKKEKPRRHRRKRGEKATVQVKDESVEADGAEAEVAETEAPEEAETDDAEHVETTEEEPAAVEAPRGGLRNRRPTGKSSGADRRRRSRRGVTVED
jgi:MFS family permease